MLVVFGALMAGNVRRLRSDSAVGPFVLGLHENREKVPHPGLQHVASQPVSNVSYGFYLEEISCNGSVSKHLGPNPVLGF